MRWVNSLDIFNKKYGSTEEFPISEIWNYLDEDGFPVACITVSKMGNVFNSLTKDYSPTVDEAKRLIEAHFE